AVTFDPTATILAYLGDEQLSRPWIGRAPSGTVPARIGIAPFTLQDFDCVDLWERRSMASFGTIRPKLIAIMIVPAVSRRRLSRSEVPASNAGRWQVVEGRSPF